MLVVAVHDHELEAMRDIVLNVRALAPIIAPAKADYERKLLNLAQMVEDVVSRAEIEGRPA